MKKEKTTTDDAMFAKKDETKQGQPNLFGEQDFVFNALQEEISGIHATIERTAEAIDKKKELLEDLKSRKTKLDTAAKIVRESKHLLKKEEKEEGF